MVRRRSSVAGRRVARSPIAAASRAVAALSGSPCAQELRPGQVQPEVEVAQPEPGVGAELPRLLERARRVAAHAPALLGVDPAR